jgi:hypothetical protein
MREIDLVDTQVLPKRLEDIVKSFEIIYNHVISADLEDVQIDLLCPSELFLEKDKLALVFKKTVEENYDVPIVATRFFDVYRILDGHHRSYILRKLGRERLPAYVLRDIESKKYMLVCYPTLEDMPIKDVGLIDDPYILGWSHILSVLKYYEAIYKIAFRMEEKYIPLGDLVPTQPVVDVRRLESMVKVMVPITCISEGGKFYIVDGHARAMAAKRDGYETIRSIVLMPTRMIEYGIVKTAEKMGLKGIDDIKLMEE